MFVTGMKYSRYNSWIKIQHFYTYDRWVIAANSLGKYLRNLHILKKTCSWSTSLACIISSSSCAAFDITTLQANTENKEVKQYKSPDKSPHQHHTVLSILVLSFVWNHAISDCLFTDSCALGYLPKSVMQVKFLITQD